jgi:hypothetical protein
MKKALRSVALIAATSVFIGWAAFLAGSEERTERLSPALEQRLQQLRPGEKVAVVVELAEQANLSQVISKIPKASRRARARAVVEALRSVADQTQPSLRDHFQKQRAAGTA